MPWELLAQRGVEAHTSTELSAAQIEGENESKDNAAIISKPISPVIDSNITNVLKDPETVTKDNKSGGKALVTNEVKAKTAADSITSVNAKDIVKNDNTNNDKVRNASGSPNSDDSIK